MDRGWVVTASCLAFGLLFIPALTVDEECLEGQTNCMFTCNPGQNCSYRICTGKTATMMCGIGTVIKVSNIWWGRASSQICSDSKGSDLKGRNCTPDDETQLKQLNNGIQLCNNETTCALEASFDFKDGCGKDMWGDPCRNIGKYLVFNFSCVAGAPHSYWPSWGSWGACNLTCSGGIRHRNRTCIDPPFFKLCSSQTCKAKGLSYQYQNETGCGNASCPVTSSPSTSFIMASTDSMSLQVVLQTSTLSLTIEPTPTSSVQSTSEAASSSTDTYILPDGTSTRGAAASTDSGLVVEPTSVITTITLPSSSAVVLPPVTRPQPTTVTTTTSKVPDAYGNMTLVYAWKVFCKDLKDDFKMVLSAVLTKKKGVEYKVDRFVIMNEDECVKNPDANTTVLFYVTTNSKADDDLTETLVLELQRILKSGQTGIFGKLENMISYVVLIIHRHEKDRWPAWLIVLIVFAVLILLLWLLCCLWLCCWRKRDRLGQKYRFTWTSPEKAKAEPIDGYPNPKFDDDDDAPSNHHPGVKVELTPVEPMKPTNDIEMVAKPPPSPSTFAPISVQLTVSPKDKDQADPSSKAQKDDESSSSDSSDDDDPSPPPFGDDDDDDEDDDDNDSNNSPKKFTRVYLDGKLVSEIPHEIGDTRITLKAPIS